MMQFAGVGPRRDNDQTAWVLDSWVAEGICSDLSAPGWQAQWGRPGSRTTRGKSDWMSMLGRKKAGSGQGAGGLELEMEQGNQGAKETAGTMQRAWRTCRGLRTPENCVGRGAGQQSTRLFFGDNDDGTAGGMLVQLVQLEKLQGCMGIHPNWAKGHY
jgi:hypothetical protein